MKSSLEIAQEHRLIPIESIADTIGLLPSEVEPYGRCRARVSLSVLDRPKDAPDAKLVCVVGMTPTRAQSPRHKRTVRFVGEQSSRRLRAARFSPVADHAS